MKFKVGDTVKTVLCRRVDKNGPPYVGEVTMVGQDPGGYIYGVDVGDGIACLGEEELEEG